MPVIGLRGLPGLLLLLVLLFHVTCGSAKKAQASLGVWEEKTECDSRAHRKSTLKLIKETPFVGLFRDLRGQSKFEASGLALVDGKYYVVFDRCA
jgi:hypothetical protein